MTPPVAQNQVLRQPDHEEGAEHLVSPRQGQGEPQRVEGEAGPGGTTRRDQQQEASPEHARHEKASHYIRRVRNDVMDVVERWTSEYRYRISEVLKDMVRRCDELGLRVARDDESMKPEMVACLTMLVMNKLHSGGFHISL